MASLVDDLAATITCPECGHVCPARMQSCPSCLALLRPPDDADVEADISRLLASGLRMHRPASRAPFALGPACSLLRLRSRGGLVLCGGDGLIEANVDGPGIRARPPLVCVTEGATLFRLDVYEAAEAAVVAVGADGAAIGTYMRHGRLLSQQIEIRDETSAPVARLQPARQGGGFQIVETGGQVIGTADRTDIEDDEWIDDQWSVTPASAADLPMRPMAFVAIAVAAKVLLGRAEPVRSREPKDGPIDDVEDTLGPIGRTIVDGFFG
jgi:hypothetical protein